MSFEYLLPHHWRSNIKQWLQEDMPFFDVGGFLVGEEIKQAILLGKSKGVVAGIPFFNAIFEELNCKVTWYVKEGFLIDPIIELAMVEGPINKILIGERIALNLISHISGIATRTAEIVQKIKSEGYNCKIAGTRKTSPGLRLFEKYGLLVGGADTHRMDLSSMLMIKDNHIKSIGSIKEAIAKAKQITSFSMKIEVECQSIEDALEALENGADIIMLDNFKPEHISEPLHKIKSIYPNSIVEISGGITTSNVLQYLDKNLDVISMGSLTMNVNPIDFSLKVQ